MGKTILYMREMNTFSGKKDVTLYIVDDDGVQYYSDDIKAWLASGMTLKDIKKNKEFTKIG